MTQTDEKKTSQDSSRFIDFGEDTIFDTKTRLLWFKKDSYQLTGKWMNWVQTRDFIEEQNKKRAGGYGDWRFPASSEAKALFDRNHVNKDCMGQKANIPGVFPPGFGFLCWTAEVRNKIQAVRFGYRKGAIMYDDIYRVSRGCTRMVRSVEKDF